MDPRDKEQVLRQIEAIEQQKASDASQPAKVEHKCQRCGLDQDKEFKSEVLETDRKEYLRSILGMRPFSKVYSFYNGALAVELVSATVAQSEIVTSKLVNFSNGSDLPPTPQAVRDMSIKADLLLHVHKVTTTEVGSTTFNPPETGAWDIPTEYSARFGKMPDPILSGVVAATFMFKTLLQQLVQEGFDKNFWEGAGPV